MNALILQDYSKLIYEVVPEPEIGADDILVQVKACGICGSDVHGMDGSSGRRIPPIIMGHEASGIVEATGSNVRDIPIESRITFDSTIYCGVCRFCRSGFINLCDNRRVLGVSCKEYRRHGAFAEFVAVPKHIVYFLPDSVTFEQAAMVEPLSIAFHAVNRTPVILNDTVVVMGVGVIGLLIIQAARLAGAGTIITIDIDRGRLDLAASLGADLVINSNETNPIDAVLAFTSGRGADRGFEAVGFSSTVTAIASCIRKGGSLTLVGNISPIAEFPLQAIVTREITLYGSCASNGEYPACIEMLRREAVDVNSLISAVAPLSEGALWFERLKKHEIGLIKVILVP